MVLRYLNKELTNEQKRMTIDYMSQYHNLEAVIKSKEMDIMKSHTATYDAPEGSTGTFNYKSECEDYAVDSEEIDEYRIVKKKLDLAHKYLKPTHRSIWEMRYIDGKSDTDVFHDLRIERKTYYNEKKQLINIVAECLGIGTNSVRNRDEIQRKA